MSGGRGSGSRVNNDTMRRISQQRAQQMPDELELDEMQEDNDKDAYDIDAAHDSNVIENAPLDDWDSMLPGTVEITTLYDSTTNDYIMNPHAARARRMVTDAFFGGFDTGSLDVCMRKIQDDTNFTVIKVEGVKNLPAHLVQLAYKSAHGIADDEVRTTYHGSAKVSVIAMESFRGAVSQRAKHGKGIYTGTNFWEALSYCPPDPENVMQVLICKNLVGLHTVGKQDQEVFGTAPNGRAYHTLTNLEGTILCSKNEPQLCPIGIFTMQYRIDIRSTLKHQANVVFIHHELLQRINAAWAKQAPAPAGPLVPAGARAAKPQWVDKTHDVCGIGRAVDIDEIPDDKHGPYKGCKGVIRKSEVKDAGKDASFRFYIQVALDSHGQPVDAQVVNSDIARINTGKFQWVHGMHRCCMRLNAKHISIIYGPEAEAVRAAAEAAWVGGVGAPAAGASAAASAAPLEWVHKAHPTWLLDKEAIIKKACKGKYDKYVGFKGVVKGSFARGGQYNIFVQPTHDQHGQPVSADTLRDIITMHEKCFMFLKGADRHIIDTLGCLPVLQNGLDSPPQAASKRPADGQADELAGAKKVRPAGGEAP